MKKHMSRFNVFQLTVIVIAAILLIILLFMANAAENTVIVQEPPSGYYQIHDCTYKETERSDAPAGVTEEYAFTLPENMQRDASLVFLLAHQFAQVYMDGRCIYSLMPDENYSAIKTPGHTWAVVPVYQKDAGKEIHVVITPVYKNVRGRTVNFEIGSKGSILLRQMRRDTLPATICALLIFSGIVILAVSVYYFCMYRQGLEAISYSGLAICIGVWRGLTLNSAPLIFPGNSELLFYLSISAMMFTMIPFIFTQRKRIGSKLADGYTAAAALIFITLMAFQLAGVADLREFLYIIQAVMLAGFVLVLVMELVNQKKAQTGLSLESVTALLLTIGALADFSVFYAKHDTVASNWLLVAQLIIILLSVACLIVKYERQIQRLAKQEAELSKSRLTLLTRQIDSHLVFNVLNAVSGMCRYDPEKADHTVTCFARYLRENIDVMQRDQPIPFTVALDNIENYWELMRLRYGEKFHLEEQIETDRFLIPPLVLQTLIENSVQHGLNGKPEGGTVILRAWTENGNFMVSVQDDGMGFDPGTVGEGSVGLRNARLRLQYMMDGQLEVQSAPGQGTTAVITLPPSAAIQELEV